MKKLLAVLLFAAIPSIADEASRRAKAQVLLDAMNMRQVQEQMMGSIKQMALSQIPTEKGSEAAAQAAKDVTSKMMDLITSRLGWDSMKSEYARIYAESFTDEELDNIVGFYQSAAGKAMMAKMPVLMQKSMGLAQERMKDLKPEIDRITREAMDKASGK